MTTWEDEMRRALEADGEKLRQLTGKDHGPGQVVVCPECDGEGRLYASVAGQWDAEDRGACPNCEGTGIIIEFASAGAKRQK